MRPIVIIADDFGVSDGVNRAVVVLHKAGVLGGASLMTNMPRAREAAEVAAKEGIPTGIHLCLAAGSPLVCPGDVPSLVGGKGRFLKRHQLVCRLLAGGVSRADVQRELDAQVTRFLEFGLVPDHVNSDQHVHLLPVVREVAVDIARRLGTALRIPDERLFVEKRRYRLHPGSTVKHVLKALCWILRRKCRRGGVPTNDDFLSVFGFIPRRAPGIDEFEVMLAGVRSRLTELMVHPAFPDRELVAFWVDGARSAPDRLKELECLRSQAFKECLQRNDLVPCCYQRALEKAGYQ